MDSFLKKLLLQTARNAIREKFTGKVLIDKDRLLKKYPELNNPGAAFVTLNKNNQLRGCIGSIEPYRPLIDDIIDNAKSAAFSDPRFTSPEPEELEEIKLEISILSNPEPVSYKSIDELMTKIQPFTDGVILTSGFHRAVFLPQVWEQLPGFNLFFQHLCKKAGLSDNCLKDYPSIEKFRVTIIEES